MRLTIHTITMRRELLPSVARSVSAAVENAPGVDVRWNVIFNPPTRLPWEEHIRRWDASLRELRDTWFILLSDDNQLHPDAILRWSEIVRENPAARALHVRAQWGPGRVRPAGRDHLKGGHVDGGQVMFDADFYNSFGWSYAEFGYEGHLFDRMCNLNPSAFVFVDELLAYHDRLNW